MMYILHIRFLYEIKIYETDAQNSHEQFLEYVTVESLHM